MAAQHGTRTRYNTGCRCDECKQASRDYAKARRQQMLSDKHGGKAPRKESGKVTALRSQLPADAPAVNQAGDVEAGVMAEIGGLSTADSRQGLVQIAIALARVLDSPLAIAQHPAAAGRLSETLDKIRKGADARKSKLAAVRQMTRPGSATGT